MEILPEARKFGGCYVFGIQSYAQLEDIYGVKPAATLFDVMNTRAFFRSPSKGIAEFAAGEIGEKEIKKASENYSYGADPVRDGVSTGKEQKRETIVSYSDIQTLPDLSCYVTLPGPYPAVKLALKYKPRPKIAEGFIPRQLNQAIDDKLAAVLAAREAEGQSARILFMPDPVETVPVEKTDEKPASPIAAVPTPQEDKAKVPPVTASNTFHKPASAAAAAASASVTQAGGVEQELHEKPEEQLPLPPGVNKDGEIEDMNAWDEWQSSSDVLRDMHRREEVNINHSHHVDRDDINLGSNF